MPPRSLRHRPRLVVAAALAVGAGVLGTGGCGDDDVPPVERLAQTRQAQAQDAAERAGLDDEAVAFVVQAAGAVAATFSVTYEVPDGTRAVLLQSPPSRRVDLISGTADDAVIRSVIVNRDGSFTCSRKEEHWTCTEAPAAEGASELGPFSAAAIQDTVSALAAARTTHDLRVERRTVVGEPATCLVSTPKPEATDASPGTLCISRSGAPLLVEGTGTDLRAVRYATTAAASAFRLPAEPEE